MDKDITISVKDKSKNQIEIKFDYDREIKENVKKIPGRDYRGSSQSWIIPLNDRNLIEFLSFCQKYNLKISGKKLKEVVGDVKKKAQKKQKRYDKNKQLAEKKNPDLEKIYGLSRGLSLRPFQRVGVEYIKKNKQVIIGDEMGLGKAQPLDSKVLTPTGWVKIKNIKPGQKICTPDGDTSRVKETFPQGKKDIYQIKFSDGSSVECCGEHLWSIKSTVENSRGKDFKVKPLNKFKEDIKKENKKCKNNKCSKYRIPITDPVYFKNNKKTPINSYLFGILLGDGSFRYNTPKITTGDKQILDLITESLPEKISINHENRNTYRLSGISGKENPIKKELNKTNLLNNYSHEKFIPKKYLYNSVESRIRLLQGLMDSDGYISSSGTSISFTSSSKKLRDQVVFLIRSLGGICKKSVKENPTYKYKGKKRTGKPSYKASSINLPENIIPFKLNRKIKRFKKRTHKWGFPKRMIRSINYVGKKKAKCISIKSEKSLYITNNFTVTHNTISTIGSLEHLECYPSLIVVPASLKENWKNECRKWLPKKRSINVINASDDNPTFRRRIIIINYALLTKYKNELLEKDFESVIADESHYLKNSDANRTQTFKKISKNIPYKILLSGTPVTNRPKELISQLKILNEEMFKEDFGGFWEFVNRYCNAEKTKWGLDISGASNLEELHEKLKSTCYIRRNKENVLDQLPDKTRKVINFEINNRQKYEKAKENIVQHMRDKALEDEEFQEKLKGKSDYQKKRLKNEKIKKEMGKAIGAEHLVRLSELRQLTAKGKLKPITKWIDNFLKTGEKLVLFAHHTEIADKLEEKYNCLKITGSVPSEDRQDIVDKFQNDSDEQLIVLNIEAGGVGLTLTSASHVAFVELPWTPADLNQAEDRLHRIGQENAVNVYYLLGENTIDENVHSIIQEKREIVKKVNAGKSSEEVEEEIGVKKELAKNLLNLE